LIAQKLLYGFIATSAPTWTIVLLVGTKQFPKFAAGIVIKSFLSKLENNVAVTTFDVTRTNQVF
jgi:hypothetical protein